jgi:hypothetical protein
MKTVAVDITNNHPFWQDYNNRIRTIIEKGHFIPSQDHAQYIEEWYGYEAEIQPYDTCVVLHMTEQEHTLFALKYGI